MTSYIAAAVKAKVTLVESHKMGGDCLNYGCVPSKALIRTATLARQMRHSADYGIASAEYTARLRAGDGARGAGGAGRSSRTIRSSATPAWASTWSRARATIVDPWHVKIARANGGEQTLSTRSIVIATGAQPFVPPLPGLDEVGYLTSDTLWGLRELPARLVVLGGGPIGCELAQAFARLGSAVTQVEMAPRIMVREDEEVSAYARKALEADGVTVLTGHKALRCEKIGDDRFIVVEAGGQEKRIDFDLLLCAVGRVARLQGFGLEELGIPVNRTVRSTSTWRRSIPTSSPPATWPGPSSSPTPPRTRPGMRRSTACSAASRSSRSDYSVIPWCTFIDPEVARVGLNEQEAREKGVAYEVTRYGIDDLDRAIADSAAHGWVKVLTVPGKDRILGVTIVGEHAGDLLAEYVLAMKHGLGLNKILGTIHTYPTLAEANKYAAGEWKRAHQPLGLLRWVGRFHAWRRG